MNLPPQVAVQLRHQHLGFPFPLALQFIYHHAKGNVVGADGWLIDGVLLLI